MNSTFGLSHEQVQPVLNEQDLDRDPIQQFGQWFERAIAAKLPEPNAMTLATCTGQGLPSARIVLLKSYDQRGFVFFTNYQSRKGHELAENPNAALLFFWPTLERQIRIEGTVSQGTREESEHYFHSRPLVSQVGACVSQQSSVLSDRAAFDQRVQKLLLQYAQQPVPLPDYWGGYRVRPLAMEFWQARPNRLHDRFRYSRLSENEWKIQRLSP
jgi:pyridoxamine 5'-phosphate oxidase